MGMVGVDAQCMLNTIGTYLFKSLNLFIYRCRAGAVKEKTDSGNCLQYSIW